MTVIFVILSVLDFVLSMTLIIRCGSDVESNAIARTVYVYTGGVGLALFKVATVVLVLRIIDYIKSRKPVTAARLQWLMCGAAGLAVLFGMYSLLLLVD